MNRSKPHLVSYLAALLIGVILFAAFWNTLSGSASSPVVIAGTVGVATAVILFLLWNRTKKTGSDD